jgi:hypothetical protein
MDKAKSKQAERFISAEIIQNKIYLIRGQKVIFDKDLAALYGVQTKQLTRQVRRNISRFPEDFLIKLTKEEIENLRCQFGASSWGGARYLPFVFTEQGVAMLSSVLNSERAIEVNIQIMRVFTRLREVMVSHKDLALKIEQLEGKVGRHDQEIRAIFEAIKSLIKYPNEWYKDTKVGFIVNP